ncbi:MAG: hypothetical protein WCO51_03965 [bacterium]|jgi:hypothetical protein
MQKKQVDAVAIAVIFLGIIAIGVLIYMSNNNLPPPLGNPQVVNTTPITKPVIVPGQAAPTMGGMGGPSGPTMPGPMPGGPTSGMPPTGR